MPNSSHSNSEVVVNGSVENRKGCKLIFSGCLSLLVPNLTSTMAARFYYRFLKHHAWQYLEKSNLTVYLTAIIFLACKATENLRPIRDIYNVISLMRHPNTSLSDLDKGYCMRKEHIIATEHHLLRVLRFDVNVDEPSNYLLNIARYLRIHQQPVHLAWRLLNDSYLSEKVIETDSCLLATACLWCGMELAKRHNRDVRIAADPLPQLWYSQFTVTEENLRKTCLWVLEIWEDEIQATSC